MSLFKRASGIARRAGGEGDEKGVFDFVRGCVVHGATDCPGPGRFAVLAVRFGNWIFDDLGSQRPFVAILHPSGDLYVSKIFNLPPNTTFQSQIWCGSGSNQSPPVTTDADGTLAAQCHKGFVANAALGNPGTCAWVSFFIPNVGLSPLSSIFCPVHGRF